MLLRILRAPDQFISFKSTTKEKIEKVDRGSTEKKTAE